MIRRFSKKCNFLMALGRSKPSLFLAVSLFLFWGILGQVSAQTSLCQEIGLNFVPDITIGTNVHSVTKTSSLAGITGWNSKKILVKGWLEIDTDFEIKDCALKMGSFSAIKLDGVHTFKSENSKYFHCGTDLWTGFIIEAGSGSPFISFNTNRIEDAAKAIDLRKSDMNIGIVGNTINRNLVGLYANNIAVKALIAGNKFDAIPLPNSFVMSTAGIQLKDCPAASIGFASSLFVATNKFHNQQAGIDLYNTTATIKQSEFNDNLYGINGELSVIDVHGYSKNKMTEFKKNYYSDVTTSQSNLNLYYCDFDDCLSTNVTSVYNDALQRVNVSDNNFNITNAYNLVDAGLNGFKYGLYLERSVGGNAGVYLNTVERNKFKINDFLTYVRGAILVDGLNDASDLFSIKNNNIDVYKGGNSQASSGFIKVYVKSSKNFKITGNIIRNFDNTFYTGQSRWGFHLYEGDSETNGNYLSGNQVYGENTFDGGCCAIHASNSGPWNICGNTTDKTYRGLHFLGKCGTSVIAGNTIKDHECAFDDSYWGTGLLVDNGAYIGDQTCGYNNWEKSYYSTYKSFAAQHINYGGDNRFLVENIDDPHQAPISRSPLGGAEPWFDKKSCLLPSIPSGCNLLVAYANPDVSKHELDFAASALLSNTFLDVDAWENTRQLMKKLFEYPSLVSTNTILGQFKNIHQESSAGVYARFDSMYIAALKVAPALQSAIRQYDDIVVQKYTALESLDADVVDINQLDSNYWALRANLLDAIGVASVQRSALQTQIRLERVPLLLACAQLNAALPENHPYEMNQKAINTLLLKRVNGQLLDSLDRAILHAIARQCNQIAGRTRDRAIAMLPPRESVFYQRENPAVFDCTDRSQTMDHSTSGIELQLWPNPAKDVMHLGFEKPFSGRIRILNLSGKLMQVYEGISGTNFLDLHVAEMPSGVYILSAETSSGMLINQRFVVFK
jgi:hypothetical protein